MDIKTWLKIFEESWKSQDVENILCLFDKKVIYYETPTHKLNSSKELAIEWNEIKKQTKISLKFNIFSSERNKHTIFFELNYFDEMGIKQNFSGIYLIELNELGLCNYFYQICE
jgi:hypothetical protein